MIKHFISDELKGRATASDTEPPLLIFSNLTHQDDGIYYCRADYKWSRTQSSVIKLNIIGKKDKLFNQFNCCPSNKVGYFLLLSLFKLL